MDLKICNKISFHYCTRFNILSPAVAWKVQERERKERNGKEEYLYSAILVRTHTLKALGRGSHSFTCELHHACRSPDGATPN